MNSDVNRISFKRSQSTPSPPPPIKRAKSEHDDITLDCYTPRPLPLTAPRGVERIPLPTSVNAIHLTSQNLKQLSAERTEILRQQSRRVVGHPVVFGDGIVLNWVRDEPGSVVDMALRSESHRANGSGTLANDTDQKLRFPVVLTSVGSGLSTEDAIIIDSDEDTTRVPSQFQSGGKRPIDHSTSLNESVINGLDSLELLSRIRRKNRVHDVAPYHSAAPLPQELSSENFLDTMSSPSPSRVIMREDVTVALSGLFSDGFGMLISDSGGVGTGKEVNGAEDDTCGSGTPARQAKLPSLPSLQPIRNLIASRKRRGDPDGASHRGADVLKASQKQARENLREGTPAFMSSESDEELECQASDLRIKRVPLPKTVHGRPRRLLIPNFADLPLVAVTMRGDCHFIERKKKFRISGYSLPNPGVFRHVADVCMVGNTAVLGCDRGTHQISFVSVAGKPKMVDVAWSPHSSSRRSRDQDTQKRGVSCLAAIHAKDGHIKFFSGGYDGTIHEWTVGLETLDEPRSTEVASHGIHMDALAYCCRDRSVAASAGKRLYMTDLSRRTTKEYQFSNDIQQMHMHPQEQQLTLFEVKHLDRQVQLYDSRKGDFNNEPCMSFGHRNTDNKFSGQHMRGSVHLVHFVQASEDGYVLLWDFRNIKKAVITTRFEQAEKVVHATFADTDIAAFGEGIVTFFKDYLA